MKMFLCNITGYNILPRLTHVVIDDTIVSVYCETE
jgi:hypothetical protein